MKKTLLVIAVLVTAVLGFSFVPQTNAAVNCMTLGTTTEKISCLQELIKDLTIQITALQEQQTTQPEWCHTFNKNLKIGDEGSEVSALWTALNKEFPGDILNISYDHEGMGQPNRFGEYTASAVSEFQEKYADEILAPYKFKKGTGVAGISTRKKLNSLYGCGTVPPVACTQDAKQCPDGSYVGRTGPNCEFSKCPEIATQPSITVTSPNGGEQFTKGGDIIVKWQSKGIDRVSIRAYYYDLNNAVDVNNYMNGGECRFTYEPIPASTGSFTVAGGNTGRCGVLTESSKIKIEVTGYSNGVDIIDDFSDNYFTITSASAQCTADANCPPINGALGYKCVDGKCVVSTQSSITVTSPNGGETLVTGQNYTIKWNSSNTPATENVKIELGYSHNDPTYKAGKYFEDFIIEKTPNIGYYNWVVPEFYGTGLNPSSFRIKISDTSGVVDYSDANFTIKMGILHPFLTISPGPIAGENYKPGDKITVGWSPKDNDSSYGLTLLRKNDPTFIRWVSLYPVFSNGLIQSYYWEVPSGLLGNDYYLRVDTSKTGAREKIGYSQVFSIVAPTTQPSITVTSPNGGEIYKIGDVINIKWNSIGLSSTDSKATINLIGSPSSGKTIELLKTYNITPYGTYVSPSNGLYEWKIPNNIPIGNYKILIGAFNSSTGAFAIEDLSDNYFTITSASTQPSITVTSPNGGEMLLPGQNFQIQWSTQNMPVDTIYTVSLTNGLSPISGGPSVNIVSNIRDGSSNTHAYSWTVQGNTGGNWGLGSKSFLERVVEFIIPTVKAAAGTDKYYMQICAFSSSIANGSICRNSNTFTINRSNFVLNSPDGGESFIAGQNMPITWSSGGLLSSDLLTISLLDYTNGNIPVITKISTNSPGNITSYNYLIPTSVKTGSKFMIDIEVFRSGSMVARGLSSNYFSIDPVSVQPSITVTSPNGGEVWKVGETKNITWTSSGLESSKIEIYLNVSSGDNVGIVSNVPNTGNYSWTIPATLSSQNTIGQARIYVRFIDNSAFSDYSDNYFTITSANKLTTKYSIIVDGNTTYPAGSTIKFSVKAILSDGSAGSPDKGFAVQYNLKDNSDIYGPSVNGIFGNATYNNSTGYWDITAIAPSDLSKTYLFQTSFYCSWSKPGYCDAENQPAQINKSFIFNVVALVNTHTECVDQKCTVVAANGTNQCSIDSDCRPVCAPNWQCGTWSNCQNSTQTRTCTDLNFCGVTTGKPSVVQSCSVAACTDSDNGENYYIKGTASGMIGGSRQTWDDFCSDATNPTNWVTVQSCSGSNCYTRDHYCQADGQMVRGAFVCLNGCENGACKSVSVTPSITVTSPNGGESFKPGSKQTVTWVANPTIMSQAYYKINLVNSSGGKTLLLVNSVDYGTVPTQNEIIIPQNTVSGSYKIEVEFTIANGSNANISDISDNYFSIVESASGTVGEVFQQNYLASISDAIQKIAAEIQKMLGR